MKTKTILLLLVALLGAAACTQKPVSVNNDALIDSLLTATSDLWNSGDPEKALSWYSDDAIVFINGNIYSGIDSIHTFCMGVLPKSKNFKTYRGPYTIVNGLISATGMYTFDWQGPDQKLYPIRGSSTVYWQKSADNKWKVIMQISQHFDVVKK
jgi:ketosteroid isomerase-like protein